MKESWWINDEVPCCAHDSFTTGCCAEDRRLDQGRPVLINGKPTYKGRTWNGHKIEGLLMNSRMVQAIYDDLNPETVKRWAYKDTGKWDAERNVREFLARCRSGASTDCSEFTINLQGGSPEGYSKAQPWHNSAHCARTGRCARRIWRD